MVQDRELAFVLPGPDAERCLSGAESQRVPPEGVEHGEIALGALGADGQLRVGAIEVENCLAVVAMNDDLAGVADVSDLNPPADAGDPEDLIPGLVQDDE